VKKNHTAFDKGGKMTSVKFFKSRSILYAFIIIWVVTLVPFMGALAEENKAPQPAPITTDNPDIPTAELEYRLDPLTKDDLTVEAAGWLQVLKEHVGK
jgi:hypothetical protein